MKQLITILITATVIVAISYFVMDSKIAEKENIISSYKYQVDSLKNELLKQEKVIEVTNEKILQFAYRLDSVTYLLSQGSD